MSNRYDELPQPTPKRSLGCLSVIGIILLTIVITIGGTLWAINSQWFTKDFKPVELNIKEAAALTRKLDAISNFDAPSEFNASPENDTAEPSTVFVVDDSDTSATDDMQPEVYTEDGSKRRIELTERELNALLAKNTDMAEQLVIDLSNEMASVKLLVDLDPDFPFLGGKTLRVSSGAELSYDGDRPVVIMKGVSVWGVPIPNAWLGGLKNIDLVREFGADEGFWKSFADGIEDIRVEDGKLLIQLAE